jgi:hypothetical protein
VIVAAPKSDEHRAVKAGAGEALFRGKEIWAAHSTALRLTGLAGVLLFSFWAGMSPHWDYLYPLHVDEWFAIGYTQSTLEYGRLEYPNPYSPWEIAFHPEMGFHLLLGFLETMTGLSWMSLYRIAPGALLALLAFLTYAFGHRNGFGWTAALFVPLIPTSIRTLGPAFVAPVSAAMLFIPVTLLVLHRMEEKSRGKSLWLLLALIGGTIFIHPPTEAVITALAVLYLAGLVAAALFQKRYSEGANLLLAIGVRIMIPIVILGLWLPSLSRKVIEQSVFADYGLELTTMLGPIHSDFPQAFGTVAAAISIAGLFLFTARGEGVRSYLLPLFTLLLLAFLTFFFPMHRLGPDILYERGWLYLGLLMAIFAGYGVAFYFRSIPAMAQAMSSRLRRPSRGWLTVILSATGVAVVALALITGLVANEPRRDYAGYYHVINDSIFADFRWMGEHSLPGQMVAMGEPSLGWAYPPVAGPGTEVYQAISSPLTNRRANEARAMLASGEADVPWLQKSGIFVFYTCRPRTFVCENLENNGLFQVRRGVYLVPDSPGTR